jgi:hypothetical protein
MLSRTYCQQCNHHRYKCYKQSNEHIYKIINAFIQTFVAHAFSKTVIVPLICNLLGSNRSKLHIAVKFLQNSITTCFHFDETSSDDEDGCWKKYIQIPCPYLSSNISQSSESQINQARNIEISCIMISKECS